MSLPRCQTLPVTCVLCLDRMLQRRWVQVGLFVGTFLLAWLLGSKTAHA